MRNMRRESHYTPLIGEDYSQNYRIVISLPKFAWVTVSLPFFAFLFCIFWSVLYNFEHATFTHCQVYNVLPSISAAIGNYTPQKNIWKTAIAMQAVNRFIIFTLYYYYYKEIATKWAEGVSRAALFTYAVENISLVTLSFWTSSENYAFHKLSFITFLIISIVHMGLAIYIEKNCRSVSKDVHEQRSYVLKTRAMTANIFCIFMACYFFWRHNTYCEPLVYSMFAFFEYMVVLTNMAFHVTAAWDFAGRSLLLSMRGVRIV
ncbi:post-GPI attachment to proteins factor 2-like [Fopius arisanus]|uniref:Post-GPI attachment to proteins factor 2-like n=1 Tax=Fopius arisanus TaxID=64838 RepID=A0A9R1U3E4_9HYME|nr:PREDICTED: post-GPI attachment to proteins factor 2-like [Fopius arisanus]